MDILPCRINDKYVREKTFRAINANYDERRTSRPSYDTVRNNKPSREIASELIDVQVSSSTPFNVQRLTRSVIIYVIYKRNFHGENQK